MQYLQFKASINYLQCYKYLGICKEEDTDFGSVNMLPHGFSVPNKTNQLKNLQPIALLTLRVRVEIIAIGTHIVGSIIILNSKYLSKCAQIYLFLYFCSRTFDVANIDFSSIDAR